MEWREGFGNPRPRPRLWLAAPFVALLFLVALLVSRPADRYLHDVMLGALSPFGAATDRIVIVKVDEDTLGQFSYRSPIDRRFLADLIDTVAAAEPRLIGIDILLDQPSEPDKDARLMQSLRSLEVPAVVAFADEADGLSPQRAQYLERLPETLVRGMPVLSLDPADGVVRDLFVGRDRGSGFTPGFATAIAERLGVEVSREPQRMIYYGGSAAGESVFPSYPAHMVDRMPASWLSDRIVLIGLDVPIADRYLTPLAALHGVEAGTLPGVAIHAHATEQLLAGHSLRTVTGWQAGLLLAFCALIAGWIALSPMPVLVKPVLVLILLAALGAAAAFAFATWGALVPIAAPSLLALGVSGLVAGHSWRREQAGRRFVKQAFSRYVSPDIVEAVIEQPERLRLGGERRFITSIHTDLENFTGFCENLPPEEAARILNRYLSAVCDLFVEYGVTIDKIVGDAVIGFLGAPVAQTDQAERAVALALSVDRFATQFSEEFSAKGQMIGAARIGCHAGHALVGNFGGRRFFDYTAVGDTVNVAARLEQANKHLGTRICVSEVVVDRCSKFAFRPSGIVRLRGRLTYMAVFEPMQPDSSDHADCDDYEAAFDLMQREEKAALQAFSDLAGRYPRDRLVAFHHQRLLRGEKGARFALHES